MRKHTTWLMILTLALCLLTVPALANQWGLTSEMYALVSGAGTWGDYTVLGEQAGKAAVMHSRYHNVLLLAEDDGLQALTKAVYQPEDGRDDDLRLTMDADTLTIAYGPEESYAFARQDGVWALKEARVGGMTVIAEEDTGWPARSYRAEDDTDRAVWRARVTLADFNIRLFPRTVEEIIHLNLMHAALDSGEDILGWRDEGGARGILLHAIGKGTVPVYAAPFGETAWRAADGKAAAGLAGDIWLMRTVVNADGEAYACIRYDVSQRTQRIGYTPVAGLPGVTASTETTDDFLYVEIMATADTWLTDDPDVSQSAQFAVPEGLQLACLGLYGEDYAYVCGEIRDGEFADGGKILFGFVPLRDVALDEQFRGNEIRTDVMSLLDGIWHYDAGGCMAAEYLTLYADGTWVGQSGAEISHGSWYVIDNNPNWNLYWDDPPYEITMIRDDGTANVKGLSLRDDGFSLTNWEGSGGYVRVDEAPPIEESDEPNG
ncbi:MAG: hypothetical protein ACI4O7_13220 [Aristaeellaceae bacterium]